MHSKQNTLSLPDGTQATLTLAVSEDTLQALLRAMREQAQSTSAAGAIEYDSWRNAGALEYDSWRNAL